MFKRSPKRTGKPGARRTPSYSRQPLNGNMTPGPACVSIPGLLKEENRVKVFVHDGSICNGCYCCQIACKDEHVANDWTPYAKPQPDTGQFWLKQTETVRGQVPRVKMHYLPV